MSLSLPLLAVWFTPVLLVLLALAVTGRFRLRWGWALAAFAAYAAYAVTGYATLPDDLVTPEARLFSRTAALLVTVAVTVAAFVAARKQGMSLGNLGLTLRQDHGSLPWAILGLGVLTLIGAIPGGIAFSEMPQLVPVAYHLTLPGFEEELIYRGLLTGLFAAALDGEAALAWGTGLASVIFVLAHAFVPAESGGMSFNIAMLALTSVAGVVLAFMRLRTGSLLFPALGHNLLGLTLRYL